MTKTRTYGNGSRIGSLAVAATLVLVMAACGDDDDQTDDAATTGATQGTEEADTTQPPTATQAPPGSAPGTQTTVETSPPAAPTGEPIRVMTIGSALVTRGGANSIEQVALAYEGFVNARGGIGGRPLEVTFCEDGNDPNTARQCALDAVSQEVAAVVGGYSIAGTAEILGVLTEANIAWLGLAPLDPSSQSEPSAYPTVGGAATQMLALGQLAGQQDCATAGALQWDEPQGIYALGLFRHGLESNGGQVGPVAVVPAAATDLAPSVAVASDGVDCLAMFLSPQQGPLAVQEIGQAAVEVPLIFYPEEVSLDVIEQTGGSASPAEGGLSASWFPITDDPVWDAAKEAVESYAPDPAAVNFGDIYETQLTWVAYEAFNSVVEGMDIVDGPSVRAALDDADEVDTNGFTPPLQFRTPVVEGNPTFARIFNPFVRPLVIRDGKYVYFEEEPLDMTDLMKTYQPG